jgi:hypothetical protein
MGTISFFSPAKEHDEGSKSRQDWQIGILGCVGIVAKLYLTNLLAMSRKLVCVCMVANFF